jgi:transcriptional regulator with GAF, ATPase, and Fis domain/tetratricopeptide (TPR) repeat protein/tRNA A-37 threonylcarbamoyl transferase component Bud32
LTRGTPLDSVVVNDRFEIVRPLGSGASGEVFVARDRFAAGALVALKRLRAPELAADLEIEAGFRREFAILRRLAHPNLARVHELGRDRDTGRLFVVGEWVDGPDLAEFAQGRAPADLVPLFVQVLRAAEFIHSRGYLHCDLKPENVLVAGGATAKVLDFGLAVRRDAAPGERWTPRGTLPYVAPETLAGARPDARADLFSLGMVFFRAITGRFPMSVEPAGLPDRLADTTRFLAQPENRLPEPLHDVVARLLEPRPAARFASAAEAADWLSRGVSGAAPSGEAVEVVTGALVARDAEVERLRAIADGLAEGSAPTCLVLEGPAGVGRHRLVEEFRTECNLRAIPFHAVDASAPPERALDPMANVVEQVAASLGGEAPAVRAHRATLDRLASIGSPSGAEAQGLRDELARFLLASAEASPRVVYVRNFGRMERDAAALFAHTAVSLRQAAGRGEKAPRLLLVTTMVSGAARSSEARLLAEGAAPETLDVPPLGLAATETLFLGLFGGPERVRPRARAQVLAARVHAETGGVPLFVEESARLLAASGKCRVHDGRLELPEGIERTWRPPRGIDGVFRATLDALDPRERETVRVLALLDQPSSAALVSEVSGDARAGDALIALVRKQLAEASTETPARFRLARRRYAELARGTISPEAAKRLHARAAAALARGDSPVSLARARHLLEAGETQEAASVGIAAVRALRATGGPAALREFLEALAPRLREGEPLRREATELLAEAVERAGEYDRAVALYEELRHGETDAERLAAWLRRLASIRHRSGRKDEAYRLLEEAMQRVADRPASVTAIRVATSLGILLNADGRWADASRLAESRLALLGDPPPGEAAYLHNVAGFAALRLGDPAAAAAAFRQALSLRERLADPAPIAAAHGHLGVALQRLGRLAEAATHLRNAFELYREMGHLGEAAAALNNLGNHLKRIGDLSAAEDAFRESLEIRERLGEPYGIASSIANLGFVERDRGLLSLARERLAQGLRRFQALGASRETSIVEAASAECELRLGRFDEVDRWVDRALADEAARAMPDAEGRALLIRAKSKRAQGDLDAAATAAAAALERIRTSGDPTWTVEALVEAGRVALARNAVEEAQRLENEARSMADSLSVDALVAEVALLESERLFAAGREREAVHPLAVALRRAGRCQSIETLVRVHAAVGEASALSGKASRARRHADVAAGRARELVLGLSSDEREAYERNPLWARVRRAIDVAASAVDSPAPEIAEIGALLELNKRLASEMDMPKLLESIIDHAIAVTHAARGFLIVLEDGRLEFTVARNIAKEEVQKPEFAVSHSIVERVCREGKPIVARNAMVDERFRWFTSVSHLRLSSVVCVPFRVKEEILGALYLDNPDAEGVFSTRAVNALEAFSDQAAIAIWNLRQKKEIEALNAQLRSALHARGQELAEARLELASRSSPPGTFEGMVGKCPGMRRVFDLVERAAPTDLPVLVTGENGTGKELVARAIFRRSRRAKQPWVSQSCTAIPESLLESELFGHVRGAFTGANEDRIGLFEQADGGTLFLDEIGDMGIDMQKKLLRVLQEGEIRRVGGKSIQKVDVRLVTATNRDLATGIQDGTFREDLFYRINGIEIRLPPLRERAEDLPVLIDHFLRQFEREKHEKRRLSPEARKLLLDHSWPGNVRELRRELERAWTLAEDVIGPDHLSDSLRSRATIGADASRVRALEDVEREAIVQALAACGGNKLAAAKKLGISRPTLYAKLRQYGLIAPQGNDRDAP